MDCKQLALAVMALLCLNSNAELRRFQNAEETKSFFC